MSLVTYRADLGDEVFSHDQIVATISPKLQQLIILPTEKCNFRCTYCYEDFKIGKMPESVQASIERFMDRRIPELAAFTIQWFGGEPLVAKAIVRRLSAYAYRLCEAHGVGFHGSLTTNAFLLERSLFEELVSYNQRFYQITLDGWQDEHNAVRKLANGGATFDRIWENLLATKSLDENFTIQLRIHARRSNYQSLKVLIAKLAETFGGDSRYSLDFQHLRDLGGAGGKTVDRPLSIRELHELEVELRRDFDEAVTRLHGPQAPPPAQPGTPACERDDSRPMEVYHPPEICYAAKPNSLLIRADGRIGKCTVALSDDRNTIGAINPDGTLTIDNRRLRPWIRGLSTLDREELECPLGGLADAWTLAEEEAA